MRAIMQPDMVYAYPIWLVGLSMAVAGVAASLILELAIRRVFRTDVRRRHNILTASIFSIVGTTYAVLLAFVAMLAWEQYNSAKAATSHEAAVLLDLGETAAGLADPARATVRDAVIAYAQSIVTTEWPAQAKGHVLHVGDAIIDRISAVVVALKPADAGESAIEAALLSELDRLRDARDDRLGSAERSIPSIVWFVVITGGGITMVFAALLGTTSVRLHLVLAGLLTLSGVLVLVLLVALSNPFRGDFRVTPEPFAIVPTRLGAR